MPCLPPKATDQGLPIRGGAVGAALHPGIGAGFASLGFRLEPDGLFDHDPALDVPPTI
jgi:hypothetical protein